MKSSCANASFVVDISDGAEYALTGVRPSSSFFVVFAPPVIFEPPFMGLSAVSVWLLSHPKGVIKGARRRWTPYVKSPPASGSRNNTLDRLPMCLDDGQEQPGRSNPRTPLPPHRAQTARDPVRCREIAGTARVLLAERSMLLEIRAKLAYSSRGIGLCRKPAAAAALAARPTRTRV
jgi:hypothetical protein